MSKYFVFTKSALDKLAPTDQRYDVADSKVPGLRLLIYPTGGKTYVLYKRVKGRQQRVKVGKYDELTLDQARKQAEKLKALIALGGDPMNDRKRERTEISFGELFEIYYTEYALQHNKDPEHNRKMVEFHILPKIGNKRLYEVTVERIRRLHLQIGEDRGQGTANRVMTLVNAIFNFGIKQGYHRFANPCFGLKKFREKSRDRFLNQDELKLFFEAVAQEEELYRDYFTLLLFTGVRKSNLLSMRWADINLGLKRWRISEDEAKNGEVNIVYLSEQSMDVLKRRKATNDALETPSPYVFPSVDSRTGHLIDPKRPFQRLRDRMGVQDIRMHDLRRTLASYMAISGASLPIIGKALNHKSQISTSIYARLAHDPVIDAVNTASELMLAA